MRERERGGRDAFDSYENRRRKKARGSIERLIRLAVFSLLSLSLARVYFCHQSKTDLFSLKDFFCIEPCSLPHASRARQQLRLRRGEPRRHRGAPGDGGANKGSSCGVVALVDKDDACFIIVFFSPPSRHCLCLSGRWPRPGDVPDAISAEWSTV